MSLMCVTEHGGIPHFAAVRVRSDKLTNVRQGTLLCAQCADRQQVPHAFRVWITADDVEIRPNLRVFTSDCEWGTVTPGQFMEDGVAPYGGEFFTGWFWVRLDSGPCRSYDSQRMSSTRPPTSP